MLGQQETLMQSCLVKIFFRTFWIYQIFSSNDQKVLFLKLWAACHVKNIALWVFSYSFSSSLKALSVLLKHSTMKEENEDFLECVLGTVFHRFRYISRQLLNTQWWIKSDFLDVKMAVLKQSTYLIVTFHNGLGTDNAAFVLSPLVLFHFLVELL